MFTYKSGKSISNHRFFAEMDFGSLESGKVSPPWLPKIQSDLDTNCFPEFKESQSFEKISESYQSLFQGF